MIFHLFPKTVLLFLLYLFNLVRSDAEPLQDICTPYGVLLHQDYFFLSQKIEREVLLDLTELKSAFDQLKTNIPLFKTEIEHYDTAEELENLEPVKLIPFTEQLNLIKVEAPPAVSFSKTCQKYGATLIALEPIHLKKLNAILIAEQIDKIPVNALTLHDKIMSLTGRMFLPLTAAQFATYEGSRATQVLMLTKNDQLEHNDLPSAAINILCSKINNPFDLPGSQRSLWLRTVDKIKTTLPEILKWGQIIGKFLYPPTKSTSGQTSSTTAAPVTDLQIPPPTALSQIATFISKFSSSSSWTNLELSGFTDFLRYCDDFKSLLSTFSKLNSKPSAPSFSTWSRNPSSRGRFPSKLELEIEPHVLLKYLSLESKFLISKLVSIQPILTDKTQWQSADQTTHIKALITARVYNSEEKAHLYQIKPLFYKGQLSTMKFLITWARQAITFSSQPVLLKCSLTHPTDLSTPEEKVCHSFHQINNQLKDTPKRIECANVFLNSIGNFNSCVSTQPSVSTWNPREAVAIRSECPPYKSSVVIISSTQKKIKIVVRCTGSSQRVVELKSFPTYLETSCPIFQVTPEGEILLLPDNQAHHLTDEERPIDFLINEPPLPIEAPLPPARPITSTTSTVTEAVMYLDYEDDAVTTTTEGFTLESFFSEPLNVTYFSIGIGIFIMILVLSVCTLLFFKYSTPSEGGTRCCSCSSIKTLFQKSSCHNESCCMPQSTGSRSSNKFETEASSKDISARSSSSRQNSTSRSKLHSQLSEIELDELSNLMHERLQDRLDKTLAKKSNIATSSSLPFKTSVNNSEMTIASAPSLASLKSIQSAPGSIRKQTKVSHTFRQ